jgi:Mn2+/Fe2+ NRAMP family transporter
VTPTFLSDFLLDAGTVSWLAGLTLMAVLSATAGQSIPHGCNVPMQWGFDGKPTWMLRRRWALLWAPACAAIFGLALTIMAYDQAAPLTQASVNLALARAGMAVAFVFMHILHLAMVLRWLKRRD